MDISTISTWYWNSYVSLPEGSFLEKYPLLTVKQSNWWLTYPPETYEFVSWDYENYCQYMEKYKMFQTTNQYI